MQYIIFVVCITDEEADVPAEAMIPKYQLQDLCSEAAKLKTLGAMESVPPDRLVRLLNILEKNIRDGTRVSPIADPVSIVLNLVSITAITLRLKKTKWYLQMIDCSHLTCKQENYFMLILHIK